jgi:hypothetical protein
MPNDFYREEKKVAKNIMDFHTRTPWYHLQGQVYD